MCWKLHSSSSFWDNLLPRLGHFGCCRGRIERASLLGSADKKDAVLLPLPSMRCGCWLCNGGNSRQRVVCVCVLRTSSWEVIQAPRLIAEGRLSPCALQSLRQHRMALHAGMAGVLLKPAHPLRSCWVGLPKDFRAKKKEKKKSFMEENCGSNRPNQIAFFCLVVFFFLATLSGWFWQHSYLGC